MHKELGPANSFCRAKRIGMKRRIFITVDVESDWGGRCPEGRQLCQGLDEGLPAILDILSRNDCKATFFISAALAEKQFQRLSLIAKHAHEIASHGYEHNLNYSGLSEQQHLYQLEKSRQVLENIFSRPVRGFRTPQFRIHPKLFKNLALAGYSYDSSVVTGRFFQRYRFNEEYLEDARLNGIKEIPVSTIPLIGLPFGLLWVNAIGWPFIKKILEYSPGNQDLVFYCHPFDLVREKRMLHDASIPVKAWYHWKKAGAALTMNKTVAFLAKYFKSETLSG
jgi:peptidoglycan/xylan/chitin deacetylase (PgdA/CDA1 family)